MLIMTISGTSWHFSIVSPRSRSQLHMAGAFITFSDCLVSNNFIFQESKQEDTKAAPLLKNMECHFNFSLSVHVMLKFAV